MPLHNPFAAVGIDEPDPRFALGKVPMYLGWAVAGFVRSWLQTRRLRTLFQGLPVILLTVVLVMPLLSRDQPVSTETIDGYLERARVAASGEDFEAADFYYRKLEQLAPLDPNVVFERGQLSAERGDFGEAFRLMESLIDDDDKSNDRDVHSWLAQTALKNDVGLENPLDYARQHLVAVLDSGADDLLSRYAHRFFAELYLRQRDERSAIEHLEHIVRYSPELQLILASLYLRIDPPEIERARSHATTAVKALQTRIDQSHHVDVSTYHQIAGGQLILHRHADALHTLRQAFTRYDQEITRRQIARAYVDWADHIARKDPTAIGEQLKLLQQAIDAAPDEPLALNRILAIAAQEGPEADEAKSRLRQALVDGIAPAIVHFCLGSLAAKEGDTAAAMRHFKQSAQLNPHTAVTLNNIAYLMSQDKNADLDQALEMANQAVEMAPNAAPFRDTRGQILVRLRRWSEGIADLEYANSRMEDLPSRIAINRALALAYDNLGDPETARSYREKHDELMKQAATRESTPGEGLPKFDLDTPSHDDSVP